MSRYSSDATVLGAVVLSILGASRLEDLEPYFKKYGIAQCCPTDYYPVEPLSHMVDDIVHDRHTMDSMFDFVSMGIANALAIPLPPEVDTLEKWLTIFEGRYKTLYHGTDVGYVKCERVGKNHYQLHIRWPWADDIGYGMVYGMCKRFLPLGSHYDVYYDESVDRADEGAEETLLHVEW